MIGTVVGSYRVLQRLGQGGVGSVYRVEHTMLGTMHALKVLTLPHDRSRERLLDEGRIQARLSHRNVVAVRDVIDVGGQPGLLMDLVRGPTLARVLAAGPLPVARVQEIGAGVLAGMAEAHRLGLIHRDLKPANVLLQLEDGVVVPKVADFGLARPEVGGAGMTASGASLGTPRYMAPEQVRDPRDVDLRADVWSLGALLYELGCAQPAFEDQDLLKLYNAIGAAQFSPLSTRRSDVLGAWTAAVEAALQVERAARPADAGALLELWGMVQPTAVDPATEARITELTPRFESPGPAEVTWSGETVDGMTAVPHAGAASAATRADPSIVSLPADAPVTKAPTPMALTPLSAAAGMGLALAIGFGGAWFVLHEPPAPPVPAPLVVAEPAAPAPVVDAGSPRAVGVARAVGLALGLRFEEASYKAGFFAPAAPTEEPMLILMLGDIATGQRTSFNEHLGLGVRSGPLPEDPLQLAVWEALAEAPRADEALLDAGDALALAIRVLAGPRDATADAALLQALSNASEGQALGPYARAVVARQRGDLKAARVALHEARVLSGGAPSLEVEEALLLQAEGSPDAAAAIIDQVVEGKDVPGRAWAVRAALDAQLDRPVQAAETTKRLQRAPASIAALGRIAAADVHFAGGDVPAGLGELGDAEAGLARYGRNGEVNGLRLSLHIETIRLAAVARDPAAIEASVAVLRSLKDAPMVGWRAGGAAVATRFGEASLAAVRGDDRPARRLLEQVAGVGDFTVEQALRDVLEGGVLRVDPVLMP